MATVTVSTKGQVVLPVEVRRKLGIVPGMRLELELSPDGGAAVLRPAGRGGKPSQAKDGVGIVPNKAGAVAIEEMNQRVAKAFRAGKL